MKLDGAENIVRINKKFNDFANFITNLAIEYNALK